jgi:hypothetical protein
MHDRNHQLQKHIKGLENKPTDEVFAMLPNLIGEALPDFIEILTIATPLKKEEVEAMGLDEVTRVILAIVEVNNFREVFDNIKKAMARPEELPAKLK